MPRAALVVALVAVLAGAETAHACSCIQIDDRTQLRRADGAFVGRLLSARAPDGGEPQMGQRAIFRYRVLRRYKGRLGDVVRVRSVIGSSLCGLPERTGRRYALYLDRRKRRWTSSLCSVTSPRRMRAAAAGAAASGTGCQG